MTGPEHYAEAERVMAGLAEISNREPMNHQGTLALAAVAQVHAILALAAATALNDNDGGSPNAVFAAWNDIAGEQK